MLHCMPTKNLILWLHMSIFPMLTSHSQSKVEAFQEVVSVSLVPYLQLFQSKKLAIFPISACKIHIHIYLCVCVSVCVSATLPYMIITNQMAWLQCIANTTHNHLVTDDYSVTLQQGQQYPFIFTISPRICTFIFLQKLISLRTVANATSCGVVTITAPSGLVLVNIFITDKCSSEVPGGVSKEL